jgi:hypothetical protein
MTLSLLKTIRNILYPLKKTPYVDEVEYAKTLKSDKIKKLLSRGRHYTMYYLLLPSIRSNISDKYINVGSILSVEDFTFQDTRE